MIETVATMSAQQQTLWATVAQVNAAVIIALVVEIGVAARRHRARAILEGNARELAAVTVNLIAVVFYVAAAASALVGLFLSLTYLQAGVNASQHDATQGAVWTLFSVVFVLIGPLLALVQYVVASLAEGVIDVAAVVRALRDRGRRRRSKSSKQSL